MLPWRRSCGRSVEGLRRALRGSRAARPRGKPCWHAAPAPAASSSSFPERLAISAGLRARSSRLSVRGPLQQMQPGSWKSPIDRSVSTHQPGPVRHQQSAVSVGNDCTLPYPISAGVPLNTAAEPPEFLKLELLIGRRTAWCLPRHCLLCSFCLQGTLRHLVLDAPCA